MGLSSRETVFTGSGSGFNVVSCELHTTRRILAFYCWTGSHALSRSTARSSDLYRGRVVAKWFLDSDSRSASDPDPSSCVESLNVYNRRLSIVFLFCFNLPPTIQRDLYYLYRQYLFTREFAFSKFRLLYFLSISDLSRDLSGQNWRTQMKTTLNILIKTWAPDAEQVNQISGSSGNVDCYRHANRRRQT